MIQFNNVSKTFRRNRVLDNIDLKIELGERIALVGSNGAGKTTLIRCLLGEYTYDGAVTVNGLVPRRERGKVLQKIGFVPQLPPPLKMPVGQLVGFAASLCNSEEKRMKDIARRLGLNLDKISRLPFVKLSGGMKQKLLISIAMGRDTNILVMDEPAANLDPDARHIFFELLAERLNNSTMLISSHRLDEIAPLVNRVLEMDSGKVVLDDRVLDDASLSGKLVCRLSLRRSEEAIAKALKDWSFRDTGNGTEWEGVIFAPDRLRFLGMLSRYVGLLTRISLDEI
ncbi:MAG: ABC transporter ATP-binding protein [Nitrosomonadales bacterium]|nr:ABC transporter ATP-binding protein [Nitrosomonadales bacterium]